jgi:Fe-S cluster biosynthesis and repair protein YggX
MPQITCTRCGQLKEALQNNPYPGTELGQELAAQVCDSCWAEWERMELMIVNEYRLTPFMKAHRDVLLAKMREFLHMK